MRELKANEALCLLGKNGMIIIFINHHLFSRISNPAMFPLVLHIRHLRNQMMHILYAFRSMFTTCACGNEVLCIGGWGGSLMVRRGMRMGLGWSVSKSWIWVRWQV
jgi:hypothetical protein